MATLWKSKRAESLPSGLSFWLDANDSAYLFSSPWSGGIVTSNGASVGRMLSKVGGFSGTQPISGRRPTLVTNAQNGKNALAFNHLSTQNLSFGNIFNFGAGAFSIFIAGRADRNSSDNPILLKDTGSGAQNGIWLDIRMISNPSNSGISYYSNANNFFGYSGSSVPANFDIAAVRTSTGANDTRLYANGVNTLTITDSRNLTNTNDLRVGAYSTQGFDCFNGRIYEILIWLRALSSTELATVFSYMRTKWGIY